MYGKKQLNPIEREWKTFKKIMEMENLDMI